MLDPSSNINTETWKLNLRAAIIIATGSESGDKPFQCFRADMTSIRKIPLTEFWVVPPKAFPILET
jgi:hypothetical protein